MEFKEIVAISNMPGLYRVVANKSNGLVVTSLEDGASQFVSSRVNGITPIENISVYINGDETVDLHSVLLKMKQQEEKTPPVAPNAPNEELKKYLEAIQPDYDKERVHLSDIKKMIRWYALLKKHDLIQEIPVEEEKDPEEKESKEAKAE